MRNWLLAGGGEGLADAKNFVVDVEGLLDHRCPGCLDLNRPLIDDMVGSDE